MSDTVLASTPPMKIMTVVIPKHSLSLEEYIPEEVFLETEEIVQQSRPATPDSLISSLSGSNVDPFDNIENELTNGMFSYIHVLG